MKRTVVIVLGFFMAGFAKAQNWEDSLKPWPIQRLGKQSLGTRSLILGPDPDKEWVMGLRADSSMDVADIYFFQSRMYTRAEGLRFLNKEWSWSAWPSTLDFPVAAERQAFLAACLGLYVLRNPVPKSFKMKEATPSRAWTDGILIPCQDSRAEAFFQHLEQTRAGRWTRRYVPAGPGPALWLVQVDNLKGLEALYRVGR